MLWWQVVSVNKIVSEVRKRKKKDVPRARDDQSLAPVVDLH